MFSALLGHPYHTESVCASGAGAEKTLPGQDGEGDGMTADRQCPECGI